jgi:uncharacterized protein YcbX
MNVVGQVDSLWRYPVKSMRGEELTEAFIGYSGVYGDRLYAFASSTAAKGFPYLTGRELEQMLLYRPRFRNPDKAARPPNFSEAESMEPGLTPLSGSPADLIVDIETPSGEVLAVDDPALIRRLAERTGDVTTLTLLRSDRAMTDCRPVSLFALQTVRQLGEEIGSAIDKRRFRANIYADFGSAAGFSEDTFIGRRLGIGARTVIAIVERDPRCKMITLNPDTAEANPEVLRKVSHAHEGKAGIYGAVLVEGMVRPGDKIELLD